MSIEIRIRYAEIPLLARADLGAADSTRRVFLIGGAAPAFTLSARSGGKFSEKNPPETPAATSRHSTSASLVGSALSSVAG